MKIFLPTTLLFLAATSAICQITTNKSIFFNENRSWPEARNWAIKQNNTNEGDFQIGCSSSNTGTLPDFHTTPAFAKLTIKNNGNVGIGTVTPQYRLHISSQDDSGILQMDAKDASFTFGRHSFSLRPKSTFAQTPYIDWYTPSGQRQAYMGWRTDCFNLTLENGFNFSIFNGNVGIGVTDTKGYKLAVAGKAVAEEIVVKLQGTWPDYVFHENYSLLPLSEVKAYVNDNKHLPNVPSAAEVEQNGISVGEMNILLLKKIEELTLYMIQMNEENEQLKSRLRALERLIKE